MAVLLQNDQFMRYPNSAFYPQTPEDRVSSQMAEESRQLATVILGLIERHLAIYETCLEVNKAK